jgi:voltage-gated potassium channel
VLVERDPARVQEALERGMLVVEADASHEETLRKLHIERARGLVAAVGTDAENVYAVLTARVLAPHLFIVGRAETEDAERKLRRAGADRVVSPYAIGAQQMAQTALRPAVVDFVSSPRRPATWSWQWSKSWSINRPRSSGRRSSRRTCDSASA